MGFEKNHLFAKLEMDVVATSGGTLALLTDVPGNAMTQRFSYAVPTTPSTRTIVRSRLPYSMQGHLVQARCTPATGHQVEIYGLRLWTRELPDGEWGWSELPIVQTPAEYQPVPIPIEATPVQFTAVPIPVEATPVEFTMLPIPVEATPVQFTPLPLPVEATPVEFAPLPIPVEATPTEYTALPLPVEPTSKEYQPVKLPVEGTPESYQAMSLPIKSTPAVPQWLQVPTDE